MLIDLGNGQNRLGATALAQVYKQLGDKPADVDNAEQLKGFFDAMQTLVRKDKLLAYHDKGDGGLVVTLAEMAFAGHCGVKANIANTSEQDVLAPCLTKNLVRVLQVKNDDELDSVLSTLAANGLEECTHVIGSVEASDKFVITSGDEWFLSVLVLNFGLFGRKLRTRCKRCVITQRVLTKSLQRRR